MKKILLILTLALFAGFIAQAQDNDNDRIRDKMREFIQKRLSLTRNEAERFTPVFVRYFTEWRQTLKENKSDVLLRQQRIAELRIRYRTEFKDIVGENRSNDVFRRQDEFVKILGEQQQIKSRRDDRPNKRFRSVIR